MVLEKISPQSGHTLARCAAGVASQRYEHASEVFLSVAIMLVCAFHLAAAGHLRALAAGRVFVPGGLAVGYHVSVAGPPEWVGLLNWGRRRLVSTEKTNHPCPNHPRRSLDNQCPQVALSLSLVAEWGLFPCEWGLLPGVLLPFCVFELDFVIEENLLSPHPRRTQVGLSLWGLFPCEWGLFPWGLFPFRVE